MKVCILGAAGLIGSHLCRVFSTAGCQVFGMSRISPPPQDLDPSGWALAPVSAEDFLAAGMPWDVVIDGRAYRASDLRGIIDRAHRMTNHWIHLSSVYVYRRLREAWNIHKPFLPVPISEDTPCRPQGDYGEGKLACERLWQAAYNKRGVPVTILRLPFVFGPADRSGRIENYIRRILSGDEILLPRAGITHIDLLFAKDLAEIIYMVADRPETIGRTYNVVAGAPLPLAAYVAALATVLRHRVCIAILPDSAGADSAPPFAFPVDIVLDGSQLRKVVGPIRATALEQALHMTVKGRYE